MARLFVIPAKDVPVAVIIRRGPTRWCHIIQWDTRTDQFQFGAWIKGRIYERRCDVSPDGQLLLYFVRKGRSTQPEFTDSWTALSRAPWLKALTVWPHGSTWGGGGRFVDDRSVVLRGSIDPPLEAFPLRGIRVLDGEAPRHESTFEVKGADWCGRDHDGRTIYSLGGKLFRQLQGKDLLVADFTDLIPEPKEAPASASKPLKEISISSKNPNRRSK